MKRVLNNTINNRNQKILDSINQQYTTKKKKKFQQINGLV